MTQCLCVSAYVKMLSHGGGSCTSAPTLWFLSMRSAASSNGSTTPLDFDTYSQSCIKREVYAHTKPESNNKPTFSLLNVVTFDLAVLFLCAVGIYLSGKELRKLILPKTAPFEEKLRIHKEVLCVRHLPIFHEWFLRTFPDPTSWYDPTSTLYHFFRKQVQ